jgi:hydroxypyruvate isomerase
MAEIAVCLETFFTDLDYRERLRRVHEAGFRTYEFWFHDKRFDGSRLTNEPKDFEMFAELNEELGVRCNDFIFNHPDGGIVGALIDPADRSLILDSLEGMIERARSIDCKAFISGSGNTVAGITREAALENMVETLKGAAGLCHKHGVTLLLEPFNTKVDHPDYFLDDPEDCIRILREVNDPCVRMLYDIYHMQIMAGNVTAFVRENLEYIGHFHVAGVPGRHEPKDCELDYRYILSQIDALGYEGCVGLEYWPTVDPATSLKQTLDWLSR